MSIQPPADENSPIDDSREYHGQDHPRTGGPPTVSRATGTCAVAVCTLDRPHLLRRSLACLASQSWPVGWRLVVVDNSPDRTAEPVFQQFADAFPKQSKYVHEPRRGYAAVRNRAIREAATLDAICFIDDDQVVNSSWLSAMAREWNGDQAVVVGSRAMRIAEVPDGQRARDSLAYLWAGRLPPGPEGTNGLLIPRAYWSDRTFDEKFNAGGGEDTDLLLRLSAAGAIIRSPRDAVAMEEDRMLGRPLRDDWQRAFAGGRLFVRVLRHNGRATTPQRLRSGLGLLPGLAALAWSTRLRDRGAFRNRMRVVAARVGVVAGAGQVVADGSRDPITREQA